jgi:hypothetical protein
MSLPADIDFLATDRRTGHHDRFSNPNPVFVALFGALAQALKEVQALKCELHLQHAYACPGIFPVC